MSTIEPHAVVSRDEWLAARKRHLAHEKELTRMRDQLAAERRALPWLKVDKTYVFETRDGPRLLGDLFGANSQLVIYHFMLAPGETDGCIGCSLLADHLSGIDVHLRHHDVSLVLVSRAPLADIRRYQDRMGWPLTWASSHGSDFNVDFQVSFTPEQMAGGSVEYNYQAMPPWGPDAHGASVFCKDAQGTVYHTYSSYGRGAEAMLTMYALFDMTPKGRDEPNGSFMDWARRHDEYGAQAPVPHACCG